MAMDKQKKQLIILVVLLIGLGIAALFALGVFESTPEPAPQRQAKSPEGEPTVPPPTSGTTPVVANENLEIPAEFAFTPKPHYWPPDSAATPRTDSTDGDLVAKPGGRMWEPSEGELWPFDPLRVKNVDIVNPELRRYIDEVKRNWVVAGITRTWQVVTESVPVEGEATPPEGSEGDSEAEDMPADPPAEAPDNGDDVVPEDAPENPTEDDNAETSTEQQNVEVKRWRLVTEVWFEGRRAPFRKNDRLTGTRFVIAEIVFGRDLKDPNLTPRALVRLRGDSGEQLDLELAPANRYGEDDARRGG